MPIRGDPDHLFVGCELAAPEDGELRAAIRRATGGKFDFVALPLAAPGGQGVGVGFRPAVDSDLVLDAATWRNSVVGVVSEGLDPDATAGADEAEARRAELDTELRWAAHLGLKGVVLPPPAGREPCVGSYARAINELLLEGLFAEGLDEDSPPPLALRIPATAAGWLVWNRFRMQCDHHPRLGIALEFGAEKAKVAGSDREMQRWWGEPVRFVILRPDAFLTNRQGYPVLPRRLKALLLGLFKHRVQVLFLAPLGGGAAAAAAPKEAAASVDAAAAAAGGHVGGDGGEAGGEDEEAGAGGGCAAAGAHSAQALLDYVARLFQTLPKLTTAERFARSHVDTLQAPLQPLQDNLESETYEIFEADPIKYARYEEAVFAFLRDRAAAGKSPPFTVMVLGAGRGPLVAASLRASQRAEVPIQVWAVEKNPNAVHTLRHRRRREEAWACVEVVAEDMRAWKAPRKADALVSELLGSFGDNELSPECLDGAQHLLADDGVCIPESYVSSLAPVSAPSVWADARGRIAGTGAGGMAGGDSGQLETAYVICLHRAFYPTSGAKDCFTFRHPKHPLEQSNDRATVLEFEVETDTLVHGFAGYFDCALYRDVRISIKPETFSEGMFSWFPIFFPLQVPVFLRKGQTLRSHWWRRHDARKVWYEWALSEPTPSAIQNPGGRTWAIGVH